MSLNIIALLGRSTKEPELKHTANNVPVVSFTLAVDRTYVKPGQERQTDFIDIVAFRSTAEFVSGYVRKGQLIAVNGSLQVRTYTDKDNNKRKAYEVIAENVHFAESKRDGGKPDVSFAAPPQGEFEEVDSSDDLPF